MSRTRGLIAALLAVAVDAKEGKGMGCTAIAIDGAASVDGSAFAGMNADCGDCDFRLTYVPAKHHTETMRDVFSFPLSYPNSIAGLTLPGLGEGSKPVGQIPQVKYTYGYYASTQPLINDQGLGMGESSCAAMLMNKYPGAAGDASKDRDVPTGFVDTAALMQLALERCATARCAVDLMGDIVETYGFMPTSSEAAPMVDPNGTPAFDDAGEAYTIADASGEAWVFHVTGGVSGVLRSAWAAQRVPKGHAAFVPNAFIIGELPSEPNDDYRFSPETFRAARVAGLWDGKGALNFARTFAPYEITFHPLNAAPEPLYGSVRRYALTNLVAPGLKIKYTRDNMNYPFSVKVEKSMSHRDAMKLFRYQYEGTEFDLTQGVLAGPFRTPFRIEGGSLGTVPRGISVLRTLYSILVQTGPKTQMGWYASDTPATSVYVPLLKKATSVAAPYSAGNNRKFTRDSAWWAFDFVNNWMQLNYEGMSTEDVFPALDKWQDVIDSELLAFAPETKSADEVDAFQRNLQQRVVDDWWSMADHLVKKWNDGRHNVPAKMGEARGYPKQWADMVGFSQDVHPVWVAPASQPPASLQGYVAPTEALPREYNQATQSWEYSEPKGQDILLSVAPVSQFSVMSQALYTAVVLVVGFAWGRQRREQGPISEPLLSA